jgi:hypothetical protein
MSIEDDLNRVDEHLNSDTPRLSQLSPPGYEETVFAVPNLPSGPFTLQDADDDGDTMGPFRGDEFVPEPETNIMVRQAPGESPVYLRVLNQDGGELQTVDGLGNEHLHRIVSLDDNSLPAEDFDLPESQRQRAADMGIET